MESATTVIQAVLGVLLSMGGVFKIALPYSKYTKMPGVEWAKEFTPAQIRLLGVLETSGGVGLLVPFYLDAPMLAPLAAVGVALYMAGAMATHLRRSEYPHMLGNLMVFLLPALFVAYDRLVGAQS